VADVVIGNVILTGALAVALILFVAASSGLSVLYTTRVRSELLYGAAEDIAQIVQQAYLLANNSQVKLGSNITQELRLPYEIAGYGYTITVTNSPLKIGTISDTRVTVLTVTLAFAGVPGSASSSVLVGANINWYSTVTVYASQSLGLLIDKCTGVPGNHPICPDIAGDIGIAFYLNGKVID
jgi:hypothetical protein